MSDAANSSPGIKSPWMERFGAALVVANALLTLLAVSSSYSSRAEFNDPMAAHASYFVIAFIASPAAAVAAGVGLFLTSRQWLHRLGWTELACAVAAFLYALA